MIEVDLRDNLDCQPCGLNTTEATARSAAMLGIFNGLNGYAPSNAGSFRRIKVHVRENCVVGIPRHPASCSVATCNLPDRIGNAVQRGLAELADGAGLAEIGTEPAAVGGVMSGHDPRRGGEPYVDQLVLGWTGGAGGHRRWLADDGRDRRRWRAAARLRRTRRAALSDASGEPADRARYQGPGRRRGAPAAEAAITVTSGELDVLYLSDGTVNAPQGTRGGLAGAPAWQAGAGGPLEELELCGRLTLREGDTIYTRCCGGGGYGPPQERETDRVLADVHEGIITRRRAREVYGVDAGLQQNGA